MMAYFQVLAVLAGIVFISLALDKIEAAINNLTQAIKDKEIR